jgi:hypothetical protein
MRDLIGWARWYTARAFYVAMRNAWPFNYALFCLFALAQEHSGWGRILGKWRRETR